MWACVQARTHASGLPAACCAHIPCSPAPSAPTARRAPFRGRAAAAALQPRARPRRRACPHSCSCCGSAPQNPCRPARGGASSGAGRLAARHACACDCALLKARPADVPCRGPRGPRRRRRVRSHSSRCWRLQRAPFQNASRSLRHQCKTCLHPSLHRSNSQPPHQHPPLTFRKVS